MTLRNLPEDKARQFADLIDVRERQVVSMGISRSGHVQMTVLAFSSGESVSEEEYSGDTMYYVLEGTVVISVAGEEHVLEKGDVLKVGAGKLHSVKPESDLKLLQVTVFD